jgi:hypothetical protein
LAVEQVKPDTEFVLTVEAGASPARPRIRLYNQTPAALAICVNEIRFEIWRLDGSSHGGGADFPLPVGGSRCSVDANWNIVAPSESWSTVLELPPEPAFQSGDELIVNGFIRVGARVADMGGSKLAWYHWRGKLGELKTSRGGPTRG